MQDWLVWSVKRYTEEWRWGLDIFWFSYAGANTTFPTGDWPRWDARIPLQGPFIEDWMSLAFMAAALKGAGASNERMDTAHVRHALWDRFSQVVSRRYPQVPLIESW